MKTFKIADIMISTGLILFFVFSKCWLHPDHLIKAYFIVGGWQVISMLVHRFMQSFTKSGGTRAIYHWITAISLVTMPIGSVWILYFTAPFMALFYTGLCIYETTKMSERPLAVIK